MDLEAALEVAAPWVSRAVYSVKSISTDPFSDVDQVPEIHPNMELALTRDSRPCWRVNMRN